VGILQAFCRQKIKKIPQTPANRGLREIILYSHSIVATLFGTGKGSGAALMMFILGVAGTLMCIVFWYKLRKYKYSDEDAAV